MSKVSGIDRAIASVKSKMAVLQLTLDELEAQRQPAKPARQRKAKAAKPEPIGHDDGAGNK